MRQLDKQENSALFFFIFICSSSLLFLHVYVTIIKRKRSSKVCRIIKTVKKQVKRCFSYWIDAYHNKRIKKGYLINSRFHSHNYKKYLKTFMLNCIILHSYAYITKDDNVSAIFSISLNSICNLAFFLLYLNC